MAVYIDQLTEATTVATTDYIVVETASGTRKIKATVLQNLISSGTGGSDIPVIPPTPDVLWDRDAVLDSTDFYLQQNEFIELIYKNQPHLFSCFMIDSPDCSVYGDSTLLPGSNNGYWATEKEDQRDIRSYNAIKFKIVNSGSSEKRYNNSIIRLQYVKNDFVKPSEYTCEFNMSVKADPSMKRFVLATPNVELKYSNITLSSTLTGISNYTYFDPTSGNYIEIPLNTKTSMDVSKWNGTIHVERSFNIAMSGKLTVKLS